MLQPMPSSISLQHSSIERVVRISLHITARIPFRYYVRMVGAGLSYIMSAALSPANHLQ